MHCDATAPRRRRDRSGSETSDSRPAPDREGLERDEVEEEAAATKDNEVPGRVEVVVDRACTCGNQPVSYAAPTERDWGKSGLKLVT